MKYFKTITMMITLFSIPAVELYANEAVSNDTAMAARIDKARHDQQQVERLLAQPSTTQSKDGVVAAKSTGAESSGVLTISGADANSRLLRKAYNDLYISLSVIKNTAQPQDTKKSTNTKGAQINADNNAAAANTALDALLKGYLQSRRMPNGAVSHAVTVNDPFVRKILVLKQELQRKNIPSDQVIVMQSDLSEAGKILAASFESNNK